MEGLVDKELLQAASICKNHTDTFKMWMDRPDEISPDPSFPVMVSTKYKLLSGLKVDEDYLPWIAPIYLKHILAAEKDVMAMIEEIQAIQIKRVNEQLERAVRNDSTTEGGHERD